MEDNGRNRKISPKKREEPTFRIFTFTYVDLPQLLVVQHKRLQHVTRDLLAIFLLDHELLEPLRLLTQNHARRVKSLRFHMSKQPSMVLFTSMNLKDSRSARICSSDFPELFVRVFDHAELREKHREAAHEGFRVCEDETKRIEGLGVLEKLQRRHAGEVAQRAQRGRNPGKDREIEGEEERRGAEFQFAEDAERQLVRVGNELPVL